MIGVLSNYTLMDDKHIEAKNKLLSNIKNFYKGREKIIEGFKNEIFLLNYDEVMEEQARFEEKAKNIGNKEEKKALKTKMVLLIMKSLIT